MGSPRPSRKRPCRYPPRKKVESSRSNFSRPPDSQYGSAKGSSIAHTVIFVIFIPKEIIAAAAC